MDEAKKAEMLENIEKEIRENLPPGSQCRPRKGTLRPSHMVKADRRAKNKIARKSRKANRK